MRLLLSILALGLTLSFATAATPEQAVGQPLPKLSARFPDGEPQWQGKPTLVEFWATWCPPCRDSIPHLNQVFAKYKGQGLNIIGITDEDSGTVRKFRKQIPIDYSVAIDTDSTLAKKLGVTGIPRAFLVDKSGKVVWQGHPMSLQESTIEAALK